MRFLARAQAQFNVPTRSIGSRAYDFTKMAGSIGDTALPEIADGVYQHIA